MFELFCRLFSTAISAFAAFGLYQLTRNCENQSAVVGCVLFFVVLQNHNHTLAKLNSFKKVLVGIWIKETAPDKEKDKP